MLQLLIVVG